MFWRSYMFRFWNSSFQKRENEISEGDVHAGRRKLKCSNAPYKGPNQSTFRAAKPKSRNFPIKYINQGTQCNNKKGSNSNPLPIPSFLRSRSESSRIRLKTVKKLGSRRTANSNEYVTYGSDCRDHSYLGKLSDRHYGYYNFTSKVINIDM